MITDKTACLGVANRHVTAHSRRGVIFAPACQTSGLRSSESGDLAEREAAPRDTAPTAHKCLAPTSVHITSPTRGDGPLHYVRLLLCGRLGPTVSRLLASVRPVVSRHTLSPRARARARTTTAFTAICRPRVRSAARPVDGSARAQCRPRSPAPSLAASSLHRPSVPYSNPAWHVACALSRRPYHPWTWHPPRPRPGPRHPRPWPPRRRAAPRRPRGGAARRPPARARAPSAAAWACP